VTPSVDERMRAFLAETLAMWQVEASVDPADAPGVAIVRTPAGMTLTIERVAQPAAFLWMVRSDGGEAPGSERPCASRSSDF
jgi:hypothetical protein